MLIAQLRMDVGGGFLQGIQGRLYGHGRLSPNFFEIRFKEGDVFVGPKIVELGIYGRRNVAFERFQNDFADDFGRQNTLVVILK